jgi:diacylglycerol kinase
MNSEYFTIKSRIKSFKPAFHGLRLLLKNEHNSRIHFAAAICAIIIGILLKISAFEWCLLTIVTGIVFLAELLNSSLEKLSDIVDPALNERIRAVKDYAAAAVLISAIMALIVGGLIFIPGILDIL